MKKRTLGIVIFILPIAFVLFISLLLNYQNRIHADDYFSGVVRYDEVLASRRWHPLNGEPFDCTYAVVSLIQNADVQPPSRWLYRESIDWSKTPVVTPSNSVNILSSCLNKFAPKTSLRLETAAKNNNSYYMRLGNDTIYLYSKEQNIAAYIRYGD